MNTKVRNKNKIISPSVDCCVAIDLSPLSPHYLNWFDTSSIRLFSCLLYSCSLCGGHNNCHEFWPNSPSCILADYCLYSNVSHPVWFALFGVMSCLAWLGPIQELSHCLSMYLWTALVVCVIAMNPDLTPLAPSPVIADAFVMGLMGFGGDWWWLGGHLKAACHSRYWGKWAFIEAHHCWNNWKSVEVP